MQQKIDYYRGKGCTNRFCKDSKKHAAKTINYEKEKWYHEQMKKRKYILSKKFVIYVKKDLVLIMIIKNLKLKVIVIVVFHDSSTYDYHCIIKKLAKEFEGRFECVGENKEKYIAFSVPIRNELDNGKITTYKIKFIDRFRFMSSSLSNLVDNLSEIFHIDKCMDCKSCLEYMMFKDDQLIFRCFECKTNSKKEFNKKLINQFSNIWILWWRH